MRIALVTREFNGVMGGLERQLLTIADLLTKNGHEVIIVSLDVTKGDTFFENLDAKEKFFQIGISNPKLRANTITRLKRQLTMFKILKEQKIDYCFAFMIGSLYVSRLPTLFAGIPLILCERNSPSMYRFISRQKFRSIRFLTMLSARAVIVQFESYREKYPLYLRKKIHSIPNSVPKLAFRGEAVNSKLKFTFAGRLSFQKQVPRLINGFAIYCAQGGSANLEIVGVGEEETLVLDLIKKYRLENRILLREPHPDISLVLIETNLLCIFSLWEGFPNILAEALAIGIPGIGFRECDGVNELIIDGVNGVLVDDKGSDESIAIGLLRCETLILGGDLTSNACRSSIAQYSESIVLEKWEALIHQ